MFAILLLLAFGSPGSGQVPPDCGQEICTLLAQGRLAELRWPDFRSVQAQAERFYSPDYRLAWSRAGEATNQARAIVEILKHADEKGLDPEDYDASRWEDRLGSIGSQWEDARPDGQPREGLARFDVALTVSTLRYISDLHFGRANPGLFHSKKKPGAETYDPPALLQDLTSASDPAAIFARIEPPYPGYRRTEDALKRYLDLAREDDGAPLPATRKTVDPNTSYSGVPRLAELLRRLGDLPKGAAPAEDGVYSGALVDAVKRFQERHGLEPDGRIGRATLAELNTPLKMRIQQLDLTLERWRWVPHAFRRPPIVVNIPEFRVRGLNASYTTEIAMKIVAGRAYGHQTPVFSADLKSVIFRPYWNVPRSIQRAELVPKIAKDRSYLASHSYEVVTAAGRVVTTGAINDAVLAKLRSGELAIRQRPGPENSLGLVKFVLPNPYDVYLHATPAMELFSRTRRDFSHGCIRVENPKGLAEWVLRGLPEWTSERIDAAMNGDKTLEVTLQEPIPVLIVYATAVALDGGEVRFFKDIYGNDARLIRAFAERRP